MVPEDILQKIISHNINFVEKPHPKFNNLPVCPFAKKARGDNQIQYELCDLNITYMLEQIEAWRSTGKQVLTLVIPNKEMPLSDYLLYFELLKATLPIDLVVFDGHPQSTYSSHSVFTRQEPYPSFQIMTLNEIDKAQQVLNNSDWYTDEETL
jgi:hypothetical protein